jgi:hypothetical protein
VAYIVTTALSGVTPEHVVEKGYSVGAFEIAGVRPHFHVEKAVISRDWKGHVIIHLSR